MLAKKKKGSKSGRQNVAMEAPVSQDSDEATSSAAMPFSAGADVFLIPEGGWERHRIQLSASTSFDEIFAAAAAAAVDEKALKAFVGTNRDMLDYRWLYRLTAEVLRAQNTGNAARSAELRGLRDRIVRLNQRYDAPLFKEIAQAEARLGQVLGLYQMKKAPPPPEIVKAAGQTGAQVFAFWVVLCAAIAAWESKLEVPSLVDMARNKLRELGEVLGAVEAEEGRMEDARLVELNKLLAVPNQALPDAQPQDARAALQAIGLDSEGQQRLIRKLGCLSCQASRHSFQAYNPLVQKTSALYDVLVYGSVQWLSAPDIQQPERSGYTSNLVKIAVEAEDFAVSEGGSVQLYW